MENNAKVFSLTEGNIWIKIALFAFPILAGSLFQQLYTTADAVIIGRFAGKEALAAIDAVYNLIKLPVNFFTGISSGATIIISQYYGAKKYDRVLEAGHTAVLFAFAGGIFLSAAGMLLAPACVKLIQIPEEIHGTALLYVKIYFGGMAASMTYNIGVGIFRAAGDSKTPFYFLVLANFVNVALDALFVGVLGWGAAGAALTTVASQLLSCILVMAALAGTKLPCRITFRKIRLHRGYLPEILRLGLPVGIQTTLYPLTNVLIQKNINAFGTDSIAAWAVCGKLDFPIWLITDTFCVTLSTFTAQNFGAGKYDRVKKGVRAGIGLPAIFVASVSVILYFFSGRLGALFVEDTDVIELSARIMRFLAPLYVVYVCGGILPGAIRGTGETLKPMLMTLTGSCLSRLLWIAAVVPVQPELMTVIGCYPVSWAITSAVYVIFCLYYMKRLKNCSERAGTEKGGEAGRLS